MPGLEFAAEERDPLAHADQAVTARVLMGAIGITATVIEDLDVNRVRYVADLDGRLGRAGVAESVSVSPGASFAPSVPCWAQPQTASARAARVAACLANFLMLPSVNPRKMQPNGF